MWCGALTGAPLSRGCSVWTAPTLPGRTEAAASSSPAALSLSSRHGRRSSSLHFRSTSFFDLEGTSRIFDLFGMYKWKLGTSECGLKYFLWQAIIQYQVYCTCELCKSCIMKHVKTYFRWNHWMSYFCISCLWPSITAPNSRECISSLQNNAFLSQ